MADTTKTTQYEQFSTFLAQSLNREQYQAVTHDKGPLLIIAGAGSGKTRVITSRIAYLMREKNVLAPDIIALTFTNKAAREMKERISAFLGTESSLPFVGTFHSYCLKLLKKNAHLTHMPFFTILDPDDQKKIIAQILEQHNLKKKFSAQSILYTISHIKNHSINPSMEAKKYKNNALFYDIYQAYEAEKHASKSLDFDDLLLHTLKLFEHTSFAESFHTTQKHILVDEYQDTNVVQHELLKRMTMHNNAITASSITVVGDEDQSIYSWRGATIANIQNFTHDFTDTKIIKIEQNYRSAQSILNVANELIQHNSTRNNKTLWSTHKKNDRVRILSCVSEYQEAETAIECIQTAQKAHGHTSSIAILYRTHAQSRMFEEVLVKKGLPYKIIGGTQFYDRKEIKDILAYLRVCANPFDRAAFFRIINTPSRGLGKKFEEQFYELWQEEPLLDFHAIAQRMITQERIPANKRAQLQQFLHVFDTISLKNTPLDILNTLLSATQYLAYLRTEYDEEEAQSRIENITELRNAMEYHERTGIQNLNEFLHEIALMQEKMHKNDGHENPIYLMTLHAAKGLEFDMVILSGVEDGILPSQRSLDDPGAIEEERRLFYVGITRARDWLLLTNAKYRYTYGTMKEQRPSRFLRDIPTNLALREDASYWHTLTVREFFTTWLQQKATPSHTAPLKSSPVTSITPAKTTTFKLNQPVMHKKYGTGIVTHIEERNEVTFITVKFKTGSKKISSLFLNII